MLHHIQVSFCLCLCTFYYDLSYKNILLNYFHVQFQSVTVLGPMWCRTYMCKREMPSDVSDESDAVAARSPAAAWAVMTHSGRDDQHRWMSTSSHEYTFTALCTLPLWQWTLKSRTLHEFRVRSVASGCRWGGRTRRRVVETRTVREMDADTAETGNDGTTSEVAAAGLCLQLDLEDTGSYVFT